MTYPPTPEQQAAIEAFGTGDDLVIQAGAGTGKTSTLRMLAESAPRRRGLYIAFNRAIANDAKASFPRNVQSATAHSLAFRAVGHQYRDRLDGPRVPARLAAQYLDISGPTQLGTDVPILAPQQLARLAMATVARFARSADPEPHAGHVPVVVRFDSPAQRRALADHRGSTAMKGAMQTELRVTKKGTGPETRVVVTSDKQKDDEELADVVFAVQVVKLDHEAKEDGSPVTSVVLVPADDLAEEPEQPRRSPAVEKVLAALQTTDGALTSLEIGDVIAEKHGTGLRRETMSKALNDLAREGLVDRVDDEHRKRVYWTLRPRSEEV